MHPKTDRGTFLDHLVRKGEVPSFRQFLKEDVWFHSHRRFGERGCAIGVQGRSGPSCCFKKGASRAIKSHHDGRRRITIAFAIPQRN